MQTVDQWSELDRVVRPHLKRLEPGVILSPDASLGDLRLDSMARIDLPLSTWKRSSESPSLTKSLGSGPSNRSEKSPAS